MLHHGDALEELQKLQESSVDSVVTDPPYGLSKEPNITEVLTHWLAGDDYTHRSNGFMGKSWDSFVPGPSVWKEAFRVLKPGGYLLCFASTRTADLMSISIRLAGFECHPQIYWIFGSGFPKATNLAKTISKAERGFPQGGADPTSPNHGKFKGGCSESNIKGQGFGAGPGQFMETSGVVDDRGLTENAKQWDGYYYGKQSLKPAAEPVLMFQKPPEGRMVDNIAKWGVGAINVDGCRVSAPDGVPKFDLKIQSSINCYGDGLHGSNRTGEMDTTTGRHPANIIHDGSDEVLAGFPPSKGQQGDVRGSEPSHTGDSNTNCYGEYNRVPAAKRGDIGSAARFFYQAKASKSERNAGCDHLLWDTSGKHPRQVDQAEWETLDPKKRAVGNIHPTVKPLALMRYLVRLVTPPGGLVLDPFVGSGTTAKAAQEEGFQFVGCELDSGHIAIAEARTAPNLGRVPKVKSMAGQQELF